MRINKIARDHGIGAFACGNRRRAKEARQNAIFQGLHLEPACREMPASLVDTCLPASLSPGTDHGVAPQVAVRAALWALRQITGQLGVKAMPALEIIRVPNRIE
jgi:hypothetical protein